MKIIDFGLARELGEAGRVDITKLQGTIEFMSPEVMNCKTASTSADMWSVGVVTYMLLTGGKSPFYDGSRYWQTDPQLRGVNRIDWRNVSRVLILSKIYLHFLTSRKYLIANISIEARQEEICKV